MENENTNYIKELEVETTEEPVEEFEIVTTKRTEIDKEKFFKLLAKHKELTLTIDRIGKVGKEAIRGVGNVVAKASGVKENVKANVKETVQVVKDKGKSIYSRYNSSQFSRENRYKVYNEEAEKQLAKKMNDKAKDPQP